eukprot:5276117-Pleurochrysis_carterae.AAC.1
MRASVSARVRGFTCACTSGSVTACRSAWAPTRLRMGTCMRVGARVRACTRARACSRACTRARACSRVRARERACSRALPPRRPPSTRASTIALASLSYRAKKPLTSARLKWSKRTKRKGRGSI